MTKAAITDGFQHKDPDLVESGYGMSRGSTSWWQPGQ